MALRIGSELTCSMGVTDMTAAIAWYERVMLCKLLYRADAIGWCELATPMAGVNIGLSQVESVVQGGGATNVFEVADIDAAKAHLDAEGVRQDGDIQHIPGLVKLITFYDPDGNAFMFSRSEIAV
jgi:predicted enzyme related to lactoylglutathione lyase